MQENAPFGRKPTKTTKKRAGRSRKLVKSKSGRQKSAARRPEAPESERHFYWITHGQINAGFVEQIDKTYKALSADERELGNFDSLKAAADAVHASFGGVG
jgi:hypothetical protein